MCVQNYVYDVSTERFEVKLKTKQKKVEKCLIKVSSYFSR